MGVELKRIQDLPEEPTAGDLTPNDTIELERAAHGGSIHIKLSTLNTFLSDPTPPTEVGSAGDSDLVPIKQGGVDHVIQAVNLLPVKTPLLAAVSSGADADLIRINVGGVEKKITKANLLPTPVTPTASLPESPSPAGTEFIRLLDGVVEKKITVNHLLEGITVEGTLTTDAGDLTAGTLADARLSTNVPLKNAAENVFTGILNGAQYKLASVVIIDGTGTVSNLIVPASLLSGVIADARIPANIPRTDVATTFLGALGAAAFKLGATTIVSNTGVLQNVTADAGILSGTIADSRIANNVARLTALQADFTGTVNAVDYKLGNVVVLTSAGVLQNVTANASIINAGTLADARLSSNVPLKNAANTFTGAVTVNADLALQQKVGFNNVAPITKPTVSGDRGGNAAVGALITALANYGLITDSTTAGSGSGGILSSGPTSVSTSATTIFTGTSGKIYLLLITGTTGTATFADMQWWVTGQSAVMIIGSSPQGSPAGRTYSLSANDLKVAMASGTYTVNIKAIQLN